MKSALSNDWQGVLAKELEKPYFGLVNTFLKKERLKYCVFPPENLIFSALNLCTLKNTKIVILGQDPYHKPDQAHGLAFSIKTGQKKPPSLQNILKEVKSDLGTSSCCSADLTPWATQGVLLLNTSLTVRESKPLSHANIGWDIFVQAVLQKIALKKSPVIFVLWGAHAQKSGQFLIQPCFKHHLILKAAHPSPLSSKDFFGCKHFSKANNFLVSAGKKSIIW